MAELEAMTKQSTIDKPAKASIVSGISWLRYKSIGGAECTMAYRFSPTSFLLGSHRPGPSLHVTSGGVGYSMMVW